MIGRTWGRLNRPRGLALAALAAVVLTGSAQAAAPLEYTLTDLGTLGGSVSEAYDINNAGQVAGYATNASQEMRAFVYENGAMKDLGTLGGARSVAWGIGEDGQIVGNSRTASYASKAFLYRDGFMTALPGMNGVACDVNRAGKAVGWASFSGRSRAVLWSEGIEIPLGTLGGSNSQACRINDNGQVIGYSLTADDLAVQAFRWSDGVMVPLGTLGGTYTLAYGINDAGEAAGTAETPNGEFHAVLWSADGAAIDLGSLGSSEAQAVDINNRGHAVGFASPNRRYCAFVYRDGVMTNLNDLLPPGSGWYLEAAQAINDSGQIVGRGWRGGQQRAFLLTPVPSDTTAPVTIASVAGVSGANGWHVAPVEVSLSATDEEGGSGVAATYYALDGGAVQVYRAPLAISADGVHQIEFWSVDNIGNIEERRTQTVKIDQAAPSVSASADRTVLSPPSGRMTAVTVSGRLSDAVSGVDIATAAFAVWDEYGAVTPGGKVNVSSAGEFSFPVSLEASRKGSDRDGRTYRITVTVKDQAGHSGQATVEVTVAHDQRR